VLVHSMIQLFGYGQHMQIYSDLIKVEDIA